MKLEKIYYKPSYYPYYPTTLKKRIESILSPLINIHRLMARMEKETLYK